MLTLLFNDVSNYTAGRRSSHSHTHTEQSALLPNLISYTRSAVHAKRTMSVVNLIFKYHIQMKERLLLHGDKIYHIKVEATEI